MSLSDLAALGNFVSGVAVVVSLVFLYFQVRQLNAQARQAAISQQAMMKLARTTRVMEVNARMASESFAEMDLRIARNGGDVTAQDVLRFWAHARSVFANGEDTFAQHRRGLVHEADFASFKRAFGWSLQAPQLRLAWARNRALYDRGYVDFVDGLVSAAPLAPAAPDLLEQWRQDMAEAIALASQPPSVTHSRQAAVAPQPRRAIQRSTGVKPPAP